MNLEKWEHTVEKEFNGDQTWNIEAYRLGLYLSDLCWFDINLIFKRRVYSLGDQLYRSVGSINANIAEGYSRISEKEKARFYEIALGSAREARDWYFKSRHVLGEKKYRERTELLIPIVRLLQTMIVDRRSKAHP